MKKLLIIVLLGLLVLPLVQSGCSGEKEPVPSADNRWLDLLRILPENEDTVKAAYLVDLEYMQEKMPEPEYPVGHRSQIFGNSLSAYNDDEWKATLGFQSDDVTRTIESGAMPNSIYVAVQGNFSQEDIDYAAHNGPGNEDVEVVDYNGYEYYSWGEDYGINISKRSNVRPLGRGHRLALVDDFVIWILWTQGMTDMIDSYTDTVPSLADRDDYQLLAGALEDLDTVNGFFSGESHSIDHFYEVMPREKLDEELRDEIKTPLFAALDYQYRLKPYDALATGAGKDESGYFLAIVLANADEAIAKENADLLQKRIDNVKLVWFPDEDVTWGEAADEVVIETRGRLTIAKLYGKLAGYWDQFELLGVLPYEPLLVHE